MGFWLIPILHGDFLPAEKPEELLADLQCWPYSKIWQKLVVLSLTGKLHFTCCIIFCWLCIPLSPHWLEHNSKDASSSYQNEWRSLPGYCMVVIKLLPTWNVCTIIPDAYRSRSPCTPGTLHRCIWYPWLWYLLYWPLDCRQPSSYPTGLLHMWSLVAWE